VIVTGAARGIGAAVAARFAAQGAAVALLDRRADELADVAGALDGAVPVTVDLADPGAAGEAVGIAVDALGGLTDVVNNAGVGRSKPLHLWTDDDWALVIGVNLTGAFAVMRAALPILVDGGGGCLVNIASLNALRPPPYEGPYSAAKAGVVNLTMTAALEYAPTVRVNCVSPGLVDTPLTAMITGDDRIAEAATRATPLRRIGTADDVADVVSWLCSPAAAYVTGQNIVVDGGSGLPNVQADSLLRTIVGE
jgi:NAD(P)-dependent dehydrogenase (short-subunit alcohol dehydrogenase family)